MSADAKTPHIFGHPPGLFLLFFAEMWERFSYYGMRALLIFYITKGFLGYQDEKAYAVYGAYTALVYATPFIGGVLADRILGARRAVVLGGALMAAGHLLMTIEQATAFFVALSLIIVGNGFFKPNISTIVGTLYPERDQRRDGGFTIFYMGINLGAAMAPLLCGYLGETYGWHYGFGLATLGMMIGLAVFIAPRIIAQFTIAAGALVTGAGLIYIANNSYMVAVNTFVAVALWIAAAIAVRALHLGGLPEHAGEPTEPVADDVRWAGLPPVKAIYVGVLITVPILAFLVQQSELAGIMLSLFGAIALGSLVLEAIRSDKIERERLFVVLILMFFSMLFWAFFEQAGSSVSNFTDRNVDRVTEARTLTQDDVGKDLEFQLSQEQLGYTINGELFTLDKLGKAREDNADTITLKITADHVGMGVEGPEIPASVFQSANPIYILIFGLVFTALWAGLRRYKLEPNTPVKFSLGLLQLGLGFAALWYGATQADGRGMVAISWLLLGYLLHTTGELCLSPVGLSMVTKLSPSRIVSTVMGAWFLATAFSNFLAGMIASLTGVSHGGGDDKTIPPPTETVDVYGEVFGTIAITAMASAVLLFFLSPLLKEWMHEDDDTAAASETQHA